MSTPPPLPYRRRSFLGCFLTFLLAGSVLVNLLLCGVAFWPTTEPDEPDAIETHLYGPRTAMDKVAVVRADGPLIEGLDAHILQQIRTAGQDKRVKAIVVRIDSPGGSIGSSEEIHRELTRVKTGKHPRYPDVQKKPIVASMGMIAASGGYYIAMPAEKVYAEKTTLTGSIGVYAALPNVSELARNNGVRMELIKAGSIKGSGSMLHEMTPQERQPWQDSVDQAYDHFLEIVAAGRPPLTKERLRSEVVIRQKAKVYDDKGNPVTGPGGEPKEVAIERVRADGGSFTSAEAKTIGLIDDIGVLEDAVTAAASAAQLGEYRVVQYKRPPSLMGLLFGAKSPAEAPEWSQLAKGLTPRLWYMAPQCELSGILAASAPR